jgi:hypothetical protein
MSDLNEKETKQKQFPEYSLIKTTFENVTA